MSKLEIELSDELAFLLAISRGWTPTVIDESKEMIEDDYQMMQNPVTHIDFLQKLIPEFINDYVLEEGKEKIIQEFSSKFESVKYQVKKGSFDEMILSGRFEDIKTAVKSSL